MSSYKNNFLSICVCCLTIFSAQDVIMAQIQIDTSPSGEEVVEFLIGPGVTYSNVALYGADVSNGIFLNGFSTDLGLNEGAFLTTGSGFSIPGPNYSFSASTVNGTPGWPTPNPLYNYTYDASAMQFNFIPLNDTVKVNYVFGSEEYSEWVNATFNDFFRFEVTGPNPSGDDYEEYNIAIVPGSNPPLEVSINNVNNGYSPSGVIPTGPCTNCEYYHDNSFGLTLEYDGITTVFSAWVLVIPGEEYHYLIGVTDVGDALYDSGVFLEGYSFKSPGPAEFFAFDFLMEYNPQLPFDVIGELDGNTIYLDLPLGTDPTNLIASYEEHGADVFLNGTRQESGVTPNDFSEPLIYHLEGYESAEWYVITDELTNVSQKEFNNVILSAGVISGQLNIRSVIGISVKVYDALGHSIYETTGSQESILLNHLIPGLYIIQFIKDGKIEVRKIMI